MFRATWYVVVTGLQPRYRELSRQYFRARLDAESHFRGGETHRLLVLTGEQDRDSILEAIGKRDANRRIAELFAGTSDGLDQDVLGEAARRAIASVFPDASS